MARNVCNRIIPCLADDTKDWAHSLPPFQLFIFFLGSILSPYERAGKYTTKTINIHMLRETVFSNVLHSTPLLAAQTQTFLVLFLLCRKMYMDTAHLF